MIRLFAAIDDKRGIADDHGIPWQGKLPTDVKYYREKIKGDAVLMGLVMYGEMSEPYPDCHNFVLSDSDQPLRQGFEEVRDLTEFLQNPPENLWSLGGASIFAQTISYAEEIYLTRVKGDFHCTKFFPEFEQDFNLASESEPHIENGITFHFEIWKRNQSK